MPNKNQTDDVNKRQNSGILLFLLANQSFQSIQLRGVLQVDVECLQVDVK